MATKKQKREAALAKREAFLKKERERGLAAQREGREIEAYRQEKLKSDAEVINARYRAILAQHGIHN
ncbi:hypothetical protein SEA_ICEWARRIOR_65 [Streptomyces phage IceWarrior]|uniref:Uncharacterized protein n=1 Tax=Streptomyces phage IceWarrior TaxID=2510515 RepID=A0A411CR11_9CAUD|nr:hypothetical protein SEA_ICEWARRIOR_65 [Streptomyces phage IceWarrior]